MTADIGAWLPTFAAGVPLAAWIGLVLFRGRFWRADQRLPEGPAWNGPWPPVVAVIPARDEAGTIGRAVASVLGQDYAGPVSVIVVDDASTDGTASAAGQSERLAVIAGKPLPPGWTGKLWAIHQGIERARQAAPDAVYVLLADADIEHDRGNLKKLVGKAEAERLDLVSLMARLRCESAWERLLVPAFVYFFQKLYPFPWVNDPKHGRAAAAGGCMLIRRQALDAAGGVAPIRNRIIDDCALAERVKGRGPIWLGLAARVRCLRLYDGLGDVWRMVARTAYTQLRHSVLALVGTVLGMTVVYLGPPVTVAAGIASGRPGIAAIGLAAWLLMAISYAPTLAFYGQARWRALALPVAAFLYTLMTVDSARQHWRGRGGAWKGRNYGLPRTAGG